VKKIQKIRLTPATHYPKKDGTVVPVKRRRRKPIPRRFVPDRETVEKIRAGLKHEGTHKYAVRFAGRERDFGVAGMATRKGARPKMEHAVWPTFGTTFTALASKAEAEKIAMRDAVVGADELRGERTPREPVTGKWTDDGGAPLADVMGAKEALKIDLDVDTENATKKVADLGRRLDEVKAKADAIKAVTPVHGPLALLAVLDTVVEQLEHRLFPVLRPEDPVARHCVGDSDMARRIEQLILDLTEISERLDL
jgi:hypothetical protein